MTTPANDHDLLVRLDTKMDGLSSLITEMRATLSAKADASRVEKLELAVDGLKQKAYAIGGGLAVVQAALHFLLK